MFFYKHPSPNSLIVDAIQSRLCSCSSMTPSNKDGRKLDVAAHRVYSLTSFNLRTANYIAAMGAYHRRLWSQALPSLQSASYYKTRGLAYHQEAMALARQKRITARHIIDSSARQLVAAIALRRYAWLKSAQIPDDIRMQIEDLPFNGSGLFNDKTDDILENLQKFKKTAQSYNTQ